MLSCQKPHWVEAVRRLSKKELLMGFGAIVLSLIMALVWQPRRQQLIESNQQNLKTTAKISDVPLLAHGKLARDFIKQVSLDFPGHLAKNVDRNQTRSKIIYGHPDLGFFARHINPTKQGNIVLDILPPSYRLPIHFCIQNLGRNQPVYLKSLRFLSPHHPLLADLQTQATGEFSSPFFLIAAVTSLDPSQADGYTFLPIVLNKLGEIVWAHLPQHGQRNFNHPIVINIHAPGQFSLLAGGKTPYFERFNLRGEILNDLSQIDSRVLSRMKRDYFVSTSSEVMTLGMKTYYLRNLLSLWDDFPFRTFFAPPLPLITSTLGRLNLETQTHQVLWQPLNHFSPYRQKPWIHRLKRSGLLKSDHESDAFTNKGMSPVSYARINSLQFYPKHGYLLTLQNPAKVILVDKNFFQIKWTLGPTLSDDFRIKNNPFRTPLQSKLRSDSLVYVLDHDPEYHAATMRVMTYKIDKLSRTTRLLWEFEPLSQTSSTIGAMALEPHGNLLVYLLDQESLSMNVIEMEADTSTVMGKLSLSHAKNHEVSMIQNSKTRGGDDTQGLLRLHPLQSLGFKTRAANQVCLPPP